MKWYEKLIGRRIIDRWTFEQREITSAESTNFTINCKTKGRWGQKYQFNREQAERLLKGKVVLGWYLDQPDNSLFHPDLAGEISLLYINDLHFGTLSSKHLKKKK